MNNYPRRLPSFFFWMAIVSLFAVLIGFAKTFIIPVSNNTFNAPLAIHIHGAFAFAWIILFLVQTSLIYVSKYNLHQVLGYFGVFIALGVMITMAPAGLFEVNKNLASGTGESSYSGLVGTLTSGLLFFSMVLAGVLKRNDPASHKRFILLSIIVVLWPAWFRFRHYFPSVPRPDIWFGLVLADSLIIIAWIWDKLKNGSIHWVLKWVGLFIMAEQSFEVYVFDSPVWRSLGKWAYHVFH